MHVTWKQSRNRLLLKQNNINGQFSFHVRQQIFCSIISICITTVFRLVLFYINCHEMNFITLTVKDF